MNSLDSEDAWDMAELVAGRESALDRLMERHAERLFHYLLRSLQDESDAADTAQETFAKVYLHRTRFNPEQKFTTWLYAIASNLVRDRFRWRKRHPLVSLDAEDAEEEGSLQARLPARESGPDQLLQAEERSSTVQAAIAALPQELRQPLLLALYEGLSQAEIATILSCSVKAVETRIYRARLQLKKSLSSLAII